MVQVNTPINLRVKFKKVGALQYVSHLDLVRTMHKIIVRAKLPLWYTEGFNPKPKMVFAAPLSIGTESVVEFLDIRLSTLADPKELMDRLNANMTDELCVIEAYYPSSKFTDLKWFSYSVEIKTENATDSLAEECVKYLLGERVEVLKKTKSKELVNVDIRPLIKSAEAVCEGGLIKLNLTLSGDPSAFLNPELVIKALREGCGILKSDKLTEEYYSIMRTGAFFDNMTEFK